MIINNIEYLIQESETKDNIMYEFLKIDDTKIHNTNTFFNEFNKILKPPKKITNWNEFNSQLSSADKWTPKRIALAYVDSKRFKEKDPEGFVRSKIECEKIKKQNYKARDRFVFNYNYSHFKYAATIAGTITAVAGAINYITYNILSGQWRL